MMLPSGDRALAIQRAGQIAARPGHRHPGEERAAVGLGRRAVGHAVRHHRLRGADPGLRLPLAIDPRPRRRSHQRRGARPHRHRAQSRPLRPVGLGPVARPHLLVAIDVHHAGARQPQRPADLRRGQRAGEIRRHRPVRDRRPADRRARSTTSTRPSACSTPTATGSGCASAASSARAPSDAGLHLIGIAVDITEQKSLAERTVEADLRLRDAIETIPEAFVLWDAENRLVLCNSNFQRLHKLPDSAVTPGTSYETVIEVGSMPEVRTRLHGDRRPGAGRAHLRGAARRRPLAAHQRAPHQGRRLRLGRHRHHPHQGARAEAGRQRAAPARHRHRPEALADRAGTAGASSSPTSRRNIRRRRTAPRKPTRPSRNSSPI